jgi:hypothetical protein
MPKCSGCGAFNPVHLDRCDRCGTKLVPFTSNSISSQDVGRSGSKGRESRWSHRAIAITVAAILTSTFLIVVAVGFNVVNLQPDDEASLSLIVFSTVGKNYTVDIYVDSNYLGQVDLGPHGLVNISHSVRVTSGQVTVHAMAVFFSTGIEEYRGYYTLEVEAGGQYEVPLYTEFNSS